MAGRAARRRTSEHNSPTRIASLPTAGGGISRAAYARALEAGLPVDTLLNDAGLTHAEISQPEVRIPVKSQIRFLEGVARLVDDDFLGLRLAQSVDLRELGLVYYVLASSDDLCTALQRLVRYSTIINEGARLLLGTGRDLVVSFDYVGVARASDRQQIEFFVGLLVRLCRQLTGRHLVPLRIRLMHRKPKLVPDLGMFLGCAVEFGADSDQVIFPGEARTATLAHPDPYLSAMLLRYCEETLARRRNKPGDWRLQVENAIVPLLPHGEATLATVARKLGVSERTLNRRLGQEGTAFLEVLKQLRLRLAEEYFGEPGLDLTRIAWLLGYQGPSALSHAFKRWTGRSPRAVRADRAVSRD